MNAAFFFQTQQIPDDTILFDELKEQKIFFSYFQVDRNYYLFLYAQKSIDINLLYPSVEVIEELDSKQRKIRSLRGFFLYALKILENGGNYEILNTNLQSFFWKKVKNIIRQNKKAALQEFLFGSDSGIGYSYQGSNTQVEEIIKTLQNQVDSLQQKVMNLEIQLKNSKDPLSDTLNAFEDTKIIQQGDSTSKSEKGLYELSNHEKRNLEIKESDNLDSKSLSDDSKSFLKPVFKTGQYDMSSNTKKPQSEQNFITLGKIPEKDKIAIIKLGFQLNKEGKISLKKYYQSTEEFSLFQWKGYSIKYESIRQTKQQLKPSNN